MKRGARIFVAGDRNIAASALVQYFKSQGFNNVFTESTHKLNLMDANSVHSLFQQEQPEYVFLTYVKSGGIVANITSPAEFIYNNLQVQNNIIHYAYKFGVKKLLFLGSSCIYPRDCPQPIKEKYLLTGELEKTSEPYALAKIAGIKMCQAYRRQYGLNCICLIPATIYGPNDDFDSAGGHVISSLIGRFAAARIKGEDKVVVWGTGKPHREFVYIDDFVAACIFLLNSYNEAEIINVGSGYDLSIRKLALLIRDTVGFKGKIIFDRTKPDGVSRKLLDSRRIKKIGWQAKTPLAEGVRRTYEWLKRYSHL